MMTVYETADLLPEAWRASGESQLARAFNPGIIRDGEGWLMAYRMVLEPDPARRIAICRLDRDLRTVAGSVQPLSDWITFARPAEYAPQALTWFADPRLYRFGGRLFVYWNSGWHEPQNHQFLQELDAHTLRPIGYPRELRLKGTRQKLEKNWALFEAEGLYAVYTVNPHRVLRFSLAGEGAIEFSDAAPPVPNSGGYAQMHGGLRGGAPPQRHGGHFYSFCHSIENDPAGYRYVAAVYRFEARFPFAPTEMPAEPLRLEIPSHVRRALPKLNPAVGEVVYPAGATFHDGRWVISAGIDDERCALLELSPAAVLETLTPTRVA